MTGSSSRQSQRISGGSPPRLRARLGRLRRLTMAMTMAAAMAVTCLMTIATPSASAYPGPTTPIFDPNHTDTRFVSPRDKAGFDAEYSRLTGDGYMLLDLEVLTMNATLYSGVFQKKPTGLGYMVQHDMTPDEYDASNNFAKAFGLRIADFEAYQVSGVGKQYAAIWVEGVGTTDAVLVKDKTSAQMQGVANSQRDQGRMPVDVEEYSVSGCNHCYATIWVKNIDHLGWQLWWGLRTDTFADKFNELKDSHRIVAVNAALYKIDNTWPQNDDAYNKYSGVWLSDRRGRATVEVRDMDADELLWNRAQYGDQAGYRPLAFESYPVKSSCTIAGGCIFTTNYAMIWRRNTP